MARTLGVNPMQLVIDPWLETERALEAASKQHPTYADLHYLYGLLRLAGGDAGAALEEFQEALSTNPGYQRARFAKMVALRLRDGELGAELWTGEGPLPGAEEPDQTLWAAWFCAQKGDKEGTRELLRALAANPTWSGLAWFAMASFEAAWKDRTASRESLAACAEAHPLYRAILKKRGLLGGWLKREGTTPDPLQTPSAEDAEAGAGGWIPDLAVLYEYVGTAAARLGQAESAILAYEEAFLRQGLESAHQIRLANLALARGSEEEAVRGLCRAIEVDPTSVPARIALGFEYQSQGFQEEALVQFEVAARLRPGYPDVQYNLGLLYDAQGRPDDAARCLRRALEGNPGYFQARTTLANILFQQERYPDALEELSSLAEAGIRSADLHVQKAQTYLALKQAPEAVRELEEAVALNPSYARTYYTLGQAYRLLGLRRKARHAWQQYLERSRSWRDRQPAAIGEE